MEETTTKTIQFPVKQSPFSFLKRNVFRQKSGRIWELDFLRGLAILMVVFDHTMFDAAGLFGWENSASTFLQGLQDFALNYLNGELRDFWRPGFLFLFFMLSGLFCGFSRENFIRAIKLGVAAGLLSLITYLGDITLGLDVYIKFGVLHCLAVTILIYAIVAYIVKLCTLKVKNERTKKLILSVVCFYLALAFIAINVGFNPKLSDTYTSKNFLDSDSPILGMFFYTKNWISGDYFPLFPFIIPFFIGAGLTNIIYPNKQSLLPQLDLVWQKPVSFAGRHSLGFYLGGQVIMVTLFFIIDAIFA
jgi:uncharacterized membrane protein